MGTGALKSYPIKGGEFGRNRLSVLAGVLAPTTNTLLRRAGPLKGIKAVDAACGGGDVTFALARQVGPEGEVTGIDLDQEKLALARAHAKEQGIGNVNFEMADVTVAWPVTGIALVYGRFILTHLKEPHDLLKQARAVLKPNGVMLVEDIDIPGWFSYPECRALDRSFELYMALSRRRGGDPTIGRRLSLLMEAAGFEDVGTTVVQPFSRQGGAKDVATLSFAAIADGLKAEGLASAEEIAAISREMEAFNQSPDTIVSMPRIFQAWGRKT